MRIHYGFLITALGLVLGLSSGPLYAQAREQGRLLMASQILEELRGSRDQAIPDRLLERAYGIAVIPDVTKIAFFAGGRRGHGALVVRDAQGHFGNPVFITLTGGSFGWQWGVQSTDVVLVFTTPKGVEGIAGGKVTLGADASVAAGPVGRQASAATDASLKAEVYSYSRTRGVFAGVALDGTAITIDDEANEAFYRKSGVTATDIMAGKVTTQDSSAQRFMSAVNAGSATTHPSSVASSTGQGSSTSAPSTPAPSSGTAPAPASGEATRSFPLSDPQPGREPPK